VGDHTDEDSCTRIFESFSAAFGPMATRFGVVGSFTVHGPVRSSCTSVSCQRWQLSSEPQTCAGHLAQRLLQMEMNHPSEL
jgi:hypothetical protein